LSDCYKLMTDQDGREVVTVGREMYAWKGQEIPKIIEIGYSSPSRLAELEAQGVVKRD
jgi:hypothetical protein